MAKDVKAGGAFVELGVRDRLAKGLRAAQARLMSFGKAVAAIGASVAAVGTAAGAGLLAAAKKFADAGDMLDKMAIRTRVSAEELQRLGFAAERSGTDMKTLGDAIFRMNRRIANAASGTGPAVRALEELGIAAEDFNKLTPEEQFRELVDVLSQMGDQARASQLGFEVFGDQWKAISPLVRAGTEAMDAAGRQAEELGLVMAEADTQGAAKLTDAWGVLNEQLGMVVKQIGSAVAPVLTGLIERVQPVVAAVIEWIDINKALVQDTETMWQTLDNLWQIGTAALAEYAIAAWQAIVDGFFSMITKISDAWIDFQTGFSRAAVNIMGLFTDEETKQYMMSVLESEQAMKKLNRQAAINNTHQQVASKIQDTLIAAQQMRAEAEDKFYRDREAAIKRQQEQREQAQEDFASFVEGGLGAAGETGGGPSMADKIVGAFGGVGLGALQTTEQKTQEEILDAAKEQVEWLKAVVVAVKDAALEYS